MEEWRGRVVVAIVVVVVVVWLRRRRSNRCCGGGYDGNDNGIHQFTMALGRLIGTSQMTATTQRRGTAKGAKTNGQTDRRTEIGRQIEGCHNCPLKAVFSAGFSKRYSRRLRNVPALMWITERPYYKTAQLLQLHRPLLLLLLLLPHYYL